jgi:hypothetical protein
MSMVGWAVPRLETIAERLHLDSFEKSMMLLLIGKTVSPVVKTLIGKTPPPSLTHLDHHDHSHEWSALPHWRSRVFLYGLVMYGHRW